VVDRLIGGVRLAVTMFTVAPLRAGVVDRSVAGAAMALAPLVGALLGLVLGAVAVAVRALPAPSLLTGATVVALGAVLTRGLHLDGLADTVDALGSYADRERALRIMKSPEVGPFGVAAIGLVLLIQATGVAALAGRPWYHLLLGVVLANAAGRLAVSWACRRGVPAARPDGLGALVAGTVGAPVLVLSTVGLGALAVVVVPGRPWQGPVALLLALGAAGLVLRHARRRLGGITGDVLGAQLELAATVAYMVLALG
jgi:adenosylcobinamide-GDP ribazoletransferase